MRGLGLIVASAAAACGSPKRPPPEASPAAPPQDATAARIPDRAPGDAAPGPAIAQLPGQGFVTPYTATPGDPATARRWRDSALATRDSGEAVALMIRAVAADPSDAQLRYQLAARLAGTGDPRALRLLAELTYAGCDGCLAFRDDARWRDDWQALWNSDVLFEILRYRPPQDAAAAEASLANEPGDEQGAEPDATGAPIHCPAGTRRAGTWRANRLDGRSPELGEVWCARPGGVRHGPYRRYDADHEQGDATQEVTGEYRNGKRRGMWRTIRSVGETLEGAYVDGRPHGVWTELGRDRITFTVYAGGKPHGRRLQLADDAHHVLSDEHYDHGLLDGPVRRFQDQPRTLWEVGSYVRGKKHGEWQYFDEAGRLRIREHWDTGVPDGSFEYRDAGGGLIDRTELAEGTGRWVAYDVAGKKLAEGELAANQKIGAWGELAEDHAGWNTGEYRAGVATGRWQQLAAPGGQRLAEGSYVLGRRSGAWAFWRPDGTRCGNGRFRAGRPDGVWTLFDPHGASVIQQIGFRGGALITIDGVRASLAARRSARLIRFDRAPRPIATEDGAAAPPL